MERLAQMYEQAVTAFPSIMLLLGNLVAGLAIFIVGVFVGRWARKRIRNSDLGGVHVDATLKPVFASAIFYTIIAMTLYAVLVKIGVPPSSLIAAFATAGSYAHWMSENMSASARMQVQSQKLGFLQQR